MDHKLPYTLHEDAYWAAEDEEIDLFADLVVACAEGHLSPFAAAQKITNTLASEAWKNKAEVDLKNEDRPYSNHATLVAVLIGSCTSAFPPHSVVHDRLFEMIRNFLRVERQQIPNELLDRIGEVRCENYKSLDLRPVVPLWEDLRRLSFSTSCEWLAEIGDIWAGVEWRSVAAANNSNGGIFRTSLPDWKLKGSNIWGGTVRCNDYFQSIGLMRRRLDGQDTWRVKF